MTLGASAHVLVRFVMEGGDGIANHDVHHVPAFLAPHRFGNGNHAAILTPGHFGPIAATRAFELEKLSQRKGFLRR